MVSALRASFPNINTVWSRVFVDELARCGIRHAVISPGSRSTPLVLAFAAHPDITDHSVLDERAAAFFALGLAKGSRTPVALLCTSGTAAANYLPAVCEASLSNVPLLLLTADRPARLRDTGAPQTMDQSHLYGRHARWFHEVPHPEASEVHLRALRSAACHAVARCGGPDAGPVHLNIPFDKPLEPAVASDDPSILPETFLARETPGLRGRGDGLPFVDCRSAAPAADAALVDMLEALMRDAGRVLIVAGPDAHGADARSAITRLSLAAQIPVLAEAASQLRYDPNRSPFVVGTADLLFRSAALRAFAKPGLILRLGAAPTTKAMQTFIEECADVTQVFIAPSAQRRDPDHVTGVQIHCDPALLLDTLASRFETRSLSPPQTEWSAALLRAADAASGALERLLCESTEMQAGQFHHRLASLLPAHAALFVSSSMPIRDLEAFLPSAGQPVDVFCNRGVNGIDGVFSTALGVARARSGHTVLLTGDVALLHDLDGLLAARQVRANLTVLLINNDGGEMFEMLPVRSFDPAHTKHFVTPHGMDFARLAAGFDLPHARAESPEQFTAVVAEAIAAGGVRIVEVRTSLQGGRAWRAGLLSRVASEAEAAVGNDTLPEAATTLALASTRLATGGSQLHFPALLLHGFTRSTESWRAVAHSAPSARELLAADLMGHGRSPAPVDLAAYTVERCSDLLAVLLDRQGVDRVHLAGYSMGGRAALHFALAHPLRLASLTLISSSAGIDDTQLRGNRRSADALLATRIETEGLERFVDQWTLQPVFATSHPPDAEAARAARADRMAQRSAGLAHSLRGMGQGAMEPLWSALPSLAMPVLVVCGARDDLYAPIAERMASLIPGARLLRIDGAGHDVPGDRPAELRAALDAFWNSHSPA